jgi:hypothetical protein
MLAAVSFIVLASLFSLGEALSFRKSGRVRFPSIRPGFCTQGLLTEFQDFATGKYKETGMGGFKDKEESLVEAKLKCDDVSVYGAMVPKVPESVVMCVTNIKQDLEAQHQPAKTRNFNFQGSLSFNDPGRDGKFNRFKRRKWVADFAREHFADNDWLDITDAPSEHDSWGPYDHTNQKHASMNGYPKDDGTPIGLLGCDITYYKTMLQSNFTLCPGGDAPFTYRFAEAILAGSIPVINSEADDLSGHIEWYKYEGLTYFKADEVANMQMSEVELKNIAQQNYGLLIKYQTWILGDNVPPEYSDFKEPCASNFACSICCEHSAHFKPYS